MFRFVCVCIYHSLRISLKVVELIIGEDDDKTRKSNNSVGEVDLVFKCGCIDDDEHEDSRKPQPCADIYDGVSPTDGSIQKYCSVTIPYPNCDMREIGSKTTCEGNDDIGRIILPNCEMCEKYHASKHCDWSTVIEKSRASVDVTQTLSDVTPLTLDNSVYIYNNTQTAMTKEYGLYYLSELLSAFNTKSLVTFPPKLVKPMTMDSDCKEHKELYEALDTEREFNARLIEHISALTLEVIQKDPSILERK